MLKPGDQVGPYEIRGFVGQGGMGRVYRAFDPRLERTVALKVIVAKAEGDAASSAPSGPPVAAEFSARLLREARAVALLSHPNVVAVYDVGESNGHLYLAMEYVVGTTFRVHVGDGSISIASKVRWLVEAARALDAAHRAGLVHRDIKPENVMVREDGTVKVLDFGIARRTLEGRAGNQQAVDTVTGGGAIAGTPVYMAPEQIKGGDVDARCDQFAWGVMAFELLAGERPWSDAGDLLGLVARMMSEPPGSLRARVPDVPVVVETTILRALERDPTARFASMGEVAEALEPFASTGNARERLQAGTSPRQDPAAYATTTRIPTTIAVADTPPAAHTTPPRPRSRAFQLAAPLVLLALLGGAVVVVKRRASSTPPRPPATAAAPALASAPAVPNASSAHRPLSTVPEAEAAYREAMQLWHDGSGAKARAALRRAVELDPTFAAAHLELAIQTAQEDPSAAQQAFQAAFEHRQMLLPRDATLLEASEPYVRPKPDLAEWETRLTAATQLFPRNPELQLYLGRAREKQGDDQGAMAAYETSVRLDPAFIPGLAALAGMQRAVGHQADALATTEECLKRSPVAATCTEIRYRVASDVGDCHRAREEAAQWRSLEPQSSEAFAAFARALHGDGAPRPSVEEALSRRWSLLAPEEHAAGEAWDRTHLAILDGEFARADELARAYEAALPASADAYDHAQVTRTRIHVLLEAEQPEQAAKVARAYLDRMDAWTPYLFAPDASILFYEPLFRTGAITREELDLQRSRWLARERQRHTADTRPALAAWTAWAYVWGAFAETKAEALEALEQLPTTPLPVVPRRSVALDFALGKSLLRAGRARDAIPHLLRVTATCSGFDDAMIVVRARLYLGEAYEAKHELDSARITYERALQSWPGAPRSRTMREANTRLRALTH